MAGRRAVECTCGHAYFSAKERPRCGKCGARGAATETSAEAVHEYQAAQREVEAPPEPEIALIEPEDLLPAVARDQLADEDGDVPAFADPIDGEQPVAALDLASLNADRELLTRATAEIRRRDEEIARLRAAQAARVPAAITAPNRLDSDDLRDAKERAARAELALREQRATQALDALASGGGRGNEQVEALRREVETMRQEQREGRHRDEVRAVEERAERARKESEERLYSLIAQVNEPARLAARMRSEGWSPPGAHDAQAASHELLKDGIHGIRKRLDDFTTTLPRLAERLDRPSPIQAALDEQARAQALYLIQSDPRFAAAVDRAAEAEALRIAQERGEAHALLDAEVGPEGAPLPPFGDPAALAERLRREAVTHEFAAPPPRPRNPAREDLP